MQSPQHSLTEMLPDAILVRIGTSVAELCGLEDFLSLSLTSKHFYGLLMDSKETISEVIRVKTIKGEESSANKIWLPSYSLRPLRLRTLKQLALYESLKKLNLLSENRLCTSPNLQRDKRVHFIYPDLEICRLEICRNDEHDQIINCNILIHAIRNLLETHPNLHVILDSHCGTRTPAKSAWLYSHVRGRVVQEALMTAVNPVVADQAIRKNLPTRKKNKREKDLHKRISMRAWGTMVSKIVSGCEEHPYQFIAQEGKGWIEIYFRIDDPETAFPLVLPPRPSYYNKVAQEYHKHQQSLKLLAQQQTSKNRYPGGTAIPCFSFCGIG